MPLSKDLSEFVRLLNSSGVDYIIVGAHSLAFHGHPRYTGDLDVLVRPTPANAERLVQLLEVFGFRGVVEKEDLQESEQIIQLGRAPHRIDLLTSISGVSIDEAFSRRVAAEIDGLPVYILDRESLVKNKRAVGRTQDLADLEALED